VGVIPHASAAVEEVMLTLVGRVHVFSVSSPVSSAVFFTQEMLIEQHAFFDQAEGTMQFNKLSCLLWSSESS
jgi:hypothetical protein